jgi:AAA15 family ATPase/GTPase
MKIDLVEVDNLLYYINEKIRFDDYNLVIGPNGSGKTNLIRILKFISNYRIDDSKPKDISLINLELPANPSDILPFIKVRC